MAVVAQGCDYSFSHPTDPELKAAGKRFVVRYVFPRSQTLGTKNLTKVEADRHKANAIEIVSNYESYAGRADDGDTNYIEHYADGQADARAADAQHRECGGRPDAPIYFSVDFNTTLNNFPGIRQYFLGVASVIGLKRTGAYGEYDLVKFLMDNGLVGKSYTPGKFYAWQTYAWSGGMYDERCALAQDLNGQRLGSGEVDYDSAHAADYGQWGFKAPAPPTPVKPVVPAGLAGMTAQAVISADPVDVWAKATQVPYGSVFVGPGGHVWTFAVPGFYAPKGSSAGITAQGTLRPGQTKEQWAAEAGVRPEAVQQSGLSVWTYSPRSKAYG